MPFPSPESSWISGQGFWKPRMKPIIDGRCSSVWLGWKGTKSDSMSYLWCSKKPMFLSGWWQLDDKIAFFCWIFSGFGSDSLSQRVAKFVFFFFEWPFSKKFYMNWKTKTLQHSDVAMEKNEKSQFLDVVPRGKGWFFCYVRKWEGKPRVSIHRKPCWPFVPNSNGQSKCQPHLCNRWSKHGIVLIVDNFAVGGLLFVCIFAVIFMVDS